MIELRDLPKEFKIAEQNMFIPGINIAFPESKILTLNDIIRIKKERNRNLNGVDETWIRMQIQSILDGQAAQLGPYDGVDGIWRNEPCFVVGGSQGLRNAIRDGFKFEMMNGFHSIGVNHVISDYHNFEWLLFQDSRFLTASKYDVLGDYKGRMFAHIRTRLKPASNITIVYTQEDAPTEHIIDGLYSFIASGLAAINLAIVSGANPIYLLGLDNGGQKNDRTCTHYRDDYPGAKLNCTNWPKYIKKIPGKCVRYAPFADRIFNVDPLGDIDVFPKIRFSDIPELRPK